MSLRPKISIRHRIILLSTFSLLGIVALATFQYTTSFYAAEAGSIAERAIARRAATRQMLVELTELKAALLQFMRDPSAETERAHTLEWQHLDRSMASFHKSHGSSLRGTMLTGLSNLEDHLTRISKDIERFRPVSGMSDSDATIAFRSMAKARDRVDEYFVTSPLHGLHHQWDQLRERSEAIRARFGREDSPEVARQLETEASEFLGKLLEIGSPSEELQKLIHEYLGQATLSAHLGQLHLEISRDALDNLSSARKQLVEMVQLANAASVEAIDRKSAVELASQRVYWIGVVVLLVAAFVASLLVGRSLSSPLQRLASNMRRMQDGDLSVELSDLDRDDEIGRMARAVDGFRVGALEKEQLERQVHSERERADIGRAERDLERSAAETRRIESLRQMADEIERATGSSVSVVVEKMDTITSAMGALAANASGLRDTCDGVAAAAEQALSAMRQTASTTTELSVSIPDVGQKVQAASCANAQAVEASQLATDRISSLAVAIAEIDGFTQTINDIARKTNLLALNAGIEAARSGEHGLGFAVIAREIKGLAEQTSLETGKIANLIHAVQLAKNEALVAVTAIDTAIAHANDCAQAIEEALIKQIAATENITHSISETEQASADVAGRIHGVAIDTQDAGEKTKMAESICTSVAADICVLQKQLIELLRTATDEVNRRVEPRYEYPQQVRIAFLERHCEMNTIDLSQRGVKVSGEVASPGEIVSVEFPFATHPLSAEVLRVENGTTSLKFQEPIADWPPPLVDAA